MDDTTREALLDQLAHATQLLYRNGGRATAGELTLCGLADANGTCLTLCMLGVMTFRAGRYELVD
jgi:hypothetical protein